MCCVCIGAWVTRHARCTSACVERPVQLARAPQISAHAVCVLLCSPAHHPVEGDQSFPERVSKRIRTDNCHASCSETDPDALVLSCSRANCDYSAHPKCMGFSNHLASVLLSRNDWQCRDCKICYVCFDDDQKSLAYCEDCDLAVHTFCATPALGGRMPRSWSCASTTQACHGRSHRVGQQAPIKRSTPRSSKSGSRKSERGGSAGKDTPACRTRPKDPAVNYAEQESGSEEDVHGKSECVRAGCFVAPCLLDASDTAFVPLPCLVLPCACAA